MIGDGWNEEPSVRPQSAVDSTRDARRVAVVTGSRAEFGLLRPVMKAVHAARGKGEHATAMQLMVVVAGSHLVLPAETFRDVKAEFNIADIVPMQIAGRSGRSEDVESLAKGVARFGRIFDTLRPEWVVVLGDRIEAFAAGIAANIGGFALAHIHGGDRAEGIADESIRHALTKLAHLHLAATAQSAERIIKMGEAPSRVHVVGSPALDDLDEMPALDDAAYAEMGWPQAVFLMHPTGRSTEMEEAAAAAVMEGVGAALDGAGILALRPNVDPGRDGIVRALLAAGKLEGKEGGGAEGGTLIVKSHLPRAVFVGLLKRLALSRGVLVGNSSAALIEAAALKVAAVDVGTRQNGRERCGNVIHIDHEYAETVAAAVRKARELDLSSLTHPYGDGRSGMRIAQLLAEVDPAAPGLLRKRCAY